MKTTGYFRNRVLARRHNLRMEWIEAVIANPFRTEIQSDGRTRYWGFVSGLDDYLQVVVEPDGETLLTAFPDGNFRP